MGYVPSWLNNTYTLLQKLQKCIEKIENISNKEIPDAVALIQEEINSIRNEVASIDTTANNALSLAGTNETDIATLDGQVAVLENNSAFVNKSNTFTRPQAILRGSDTSLGLAVREGTASEYDYTDYSHGHITKTQNNKRLIYTYNLPDKSGDIALKSDIPTGGVVNGQEEIYAGNGEPSQIIMHAGDNNPGDVYIELRGGSGGYISRIFPMQQGAHMPVHYILPDTGNQSDTPEEQHLLSDKNTKTVFGNSIYGDGDIKLYKHLINLELVNVSLNIYVNVYSHSNTPVNSIDSLKTLLGNYFREIAYTYKMQDNYFGFISENQVYLSNGTDTLSFFYGDPEYPLMISDHVTSV